MCHIIQLDVFYGVAINSAAAIADSFIAIDLNGGDLVNSLLCIAAKFPVFVLRVNKYNETWQCNHLPRIITTSPSIVIVRVETTVQQTLPSADMSFTHKNATVTIFYLGRLNDRAEALKTPEQTLCISLTKFNMNATGARHTNISIYIETQRHKRKAVICTCSTYVYA